MPIIKAHPPEGCSCTLYDFLLRFSPSESSPFYGVYLLDIVPALTLAISGQKRPEEAKEGLMLLHRYPGGQLGRCSPPCQPRPDAP